MTRILCDFDMMVKGLTFRGKEFGGHVLVSINLIMSLITSVNEEARVFVISFVIIL